MDVRVAAGYRWTSIRMKDDDSGDRLDHESSPWRKFGYLSPYCRSGACSSSRIPEQESPALIAMSSWFAGRAFRMFHVKHRAAAGRGPLDCPSRTRGFDNSGRLIDETIEMRSVPICASGEGASGTIGILPSKRRAGDHVPGISSRFRSETPGEPSVDSRRFRCWKDIEFVLLKRQRFWIPDPRRGKAPPSLIKEQESWAWISRSCWFGNRVFRMFHVKHRYETGRCPGLLDESIRGIDRRTRAGHGAREPARPDLAFENPEWPEPSKAFERIAAYESRRRKSTRTWPPRIVRHAPRDP